MEADRFDRWTKALAGGASRRRILTGLGGGIATLLGRGTTFARPQCALAGEHCGRPNAPGGGLTCCPGAGLSCLPQTKGPAVCCMQDRVCGKSCCRADEVCADETCVHPHHCPPGELFQGGRCCQLSGGRCQSDVDCCPTDPALQQNLFCSTGCGGDAACTAGGTTYTTEGTCCASPSVAICCCPDPFTGAGGLAQCCNPEAADCSPATVCRSGSGAAGGPACPAGQCCFIDSGATGCSCLEAGHACIASSLCCNGPCDEQQGICP